MSIGIPLTLDRDTTWYKRAICRSANIDPETFFPHDDVSQSIVANAFCYTCPVKLECRNFALETRQDYGVWGGMTERERRRTRTPRTRYKCPMCNEVSTDRVDDMQICIACGISWKVSRNGAG